MRASVLVLVWLFSALATADDDAIGHASGSTEPEFGVPVPAEAGAAEPEVELRRFKKQALQSVSVGGGTLQPFDDASVRRSYLELSLGTGIPLGSFESILGVRPRFRVDWVDAAPAVDIPAELYDFECQFFYRRPISDRLSTLAIVSPSIRSDLTTDDRAFRVFALGLLNWQCVPDRLTLSLGAVALGRADLPVLPALGFVWTPNRRTKLDARFPVTRLAYRLATDGGHSEIWAYASGGLGGNTWSVTRTSGRTDELSLRDYRILFGVERLIDGGGRWFAETGVALGRRLEYERRPLERGLGDAALLQAGWRY